MPLIHGVPTTSPVSMGTTPVMLSRPSQDHPLPVEGPLMLYICPAGQYPHPISKSVNTVKTGDLTATKMKNYISVHIISSAQVHVPKGVATPQYTETLLHQLRLG